MDLTRRLALVQSKTEQDLPNLSKITIEDLQDRVIDFGTKHKGQSYQKVWSEAQESVKFMCSHYHKSPKASHRLFLRYVELMIEHLEATGQVIQVTAPSASTQMPNDVTLGYPQAKASIKPKPKPSSVARKTQMINPTAEALLESQGLEDDWSEAEMIESFNHTADIQTGQDAQHGEWLATDHPAHHRETVMGSEWHQLHAGDMDAEVMMQSTEDPRIKQSDKESLKFWSMVKQFESELQSCVSSIPCKGRSCDLFEVFCGPQSQLTSQAMALGMREYRFGYDQADLSTREGRWVLFEQLVMHSPRHLWFAPEESTL